MRPYGASGPRTRAGRERRQLGFLRDIGLPNDRYAALVRARMMAVLKRFYPQARIQRLVYESTPMFCRMRRQA